MRLHVFFGPVQEFVSQARRTRDLWAGSWLLSYLAGQAMYEIVDRGGKIILPAVQDGTGKWADPLMQAIAAARNCGPHPAKVAPVGSLPNRFEAEVPGDTQGVRQIAEAAVKAWLKAWQAEACKVWNLLSQLGKLGFGSDQQLGNIWQRQIEGLWECMWVIGEGQDLDRRKLLRSFHYEDEPGEKCTVCGRRQCLYPVNGKTRQDVREFWAELSRELRTWDIRRDGTERLCAVCTVKRLLPRVWEAQVSYPSTRTVASIPWRIEVALAARESENAGLQEALVRFDEAVKNVRLGNEEVPRVSEALRGFQGLQQAVEGMDANAVAPLLNWDGDWFTQDGILHEDIFSGLGPQEAERVRKPVLEALRQLKSALPQSLKEPTDFYAVLIMDGDRMGQILGECPARKAEVSEALGRFAAGVKDIVEGPDGNGRLIYAGGDDVLALLPVRSALDVAWRLRKDYMRCLTNPPKGWAISAGIVYTHATVPLQPIVHAAHTLLDRTAKDEAGRNAFAVQVWKRGGPVLTFGMPWEVPASPGGSGGQQASVDLIKRLVERLRVGQEGRFTNKLLYRLRDLWEVAQPAGGVALEPDDVVDLVAAEHLRTVKHAREPAALADARELARELVTLCTRWRFKPDGSLSRGRLTADAGLFLRFLLAEEV